METDVLDEIAAWLDGLDAAALRALLLEAAVRDEGFCQRLQLRAAVAAQPGLAQLRALLLPSVRWHGYSVYGDDDADALVGRIEDAVGMLEARISDGDPALIGLIEEVIGEAESAIAEIHDSDDLYTAVQALHSIHLRACIALRPDGEVLGRELLERQLDDGWGFRADPLEDYAAALGEKGRAAYWQAVEAAWAALPALTPADRLLPRDRRRSMLERIMEGRVKASGDADAVIRTLARNLSAYDRFMALAEFCQAHGRLDEALQWADEGLAAFDPAGAYPLVNFTIKLLLARGDHARAEVLAWERFVRQAGCRAFMELMQLADAIGRRDALREKAFALLWSAVRAEEAKPAETRHRWAGRARDPLLEIHLEEGDADQAWEVFQGGPVSVRLWRQVAELRGRSHPDEAIAVYRRLLPHAVEAGTHRSSYEEAAAVVQAIRNLRAAQGRLRMFGEELAGIRLEWKRKRNFMKLLEVL
ncbi:hypothetical protein ZRA01_31760 [Zoogloea ramigera]|jgi:tetratricopeptide (TPR) repeat protein|uniref:Uncharacterized protein n=1 Tax=Zoogloea ramigera TaxID=350 RepID=A0A4Y4D0K3_ZOORA|nr:hypothetical protein [Zoogloea ramigera]GEC97103.1 hypothetical protein ZRA01_31760 [Zoogloea ramigera]